MLGRMVPMVGIIVVSAFGMAFALNYKKQKQYLATRNASIDDPMVVEFYKDVTTSSKDWKNKRVPRPWEENNGSRMGGP